MSMLDAALSWAARGFRVFPLAEGTKNQPLVKFTDEATTDVEKIRAWWFDAMTGTPRHHNIGVLTTGMVVVDVDVRGGRPGLTNFISLCGLFDTLAVRTPSGGLHFYYSGPDSAGLQGKHGLGEGIDIRSHNNYVVAPGSTTDEGAYSVELELPVAPVPPAVAVRLKAPMTRENAAQYELDETPGIVSRAVAWISSEACPLAIEGAGGDDTTYRVACRLRDLGLSQEGAFAVLVQHWNDRCDPPWELDDLQFKVENAYRYATGHQGSMSPETQFANLSVPPVEYVADESVSPDVFAPGNALDVEVLPPRPWLMSRLLMLGQITLLIGAGSAGKSITSLVIAAHLALGKTFMGFTAKRGAVRSIVWDEEDDLHELSRRLWAICKHYGFDYNEVRNKITLLSRNEIDLKVAEGDPPVIAKSQVQALVTAASAADVGLVALGPFVSLHTVNEDDNSKMAFVMGLLREIATASNVAILLAHHVSKPSGSQSRAGDAYTARGAGAIVNSARIAFTMSTPTEQDCQLVGIKPEQRFEYVRFDNAKMNLSLQTARVDWLRKHSVELPNGDSVGVTAPFEMNAHTEKTHTTWAEAIAGEMRAKGTASVTFTEAQALIKAADPLAAKLKPEAIRTRIMTALSEPVQTSFGQVRLIQEQRAGGKWEKVVVLG